MALGTVNVGQPVSSDGQDYILAERIGQANGVAGLDSGGKVPAAQLPSNSTQNATPSSDGLMSASDKTKLDGVATGANKYTHPTHTEHSSGLYLITVDSLGHVTGAVEVTKADITALGIPAQDTTYGNASASAAGLMSSNQYTKLEGIASGANKTTVDAAMSATSTNPVQNKVVEERVKGVEDKLGGLSFRVVDDALVIDY